MLYVEKEFESWNRWSVQIGAGKDGRTIRRKPAMLASKTDDADTHAADPYLHGFEQPKKHIQESHETIGRASWRSELASERQPRCQRAGTFHGFFRKRRCIDRFSSLLGRRRRSTAHLIGDNDVSLEWEAPPPYEPPVLELSAVREPAELSIEPRPCELAIDFGYSELDADVIGHVVPYKSIGTNASQNECKESSSLQPSDRFDEQEIQPSLASAISRHSGVQAAQLTLKMSRAVTTNERDMVSPVEGIAGGCSLDVSPVETSSNDWNASIKPTVPDYRQYEVHVDECFAVCEGLPTEVAPLRKALAVDDLLIKEVFDAVEYRYHGLRLGTLVDYGFHNPTSLLAGGLAALRAMLKGTFAACPRGIYAFIVTIYAIGLALDGTAVTKCAGEMYSDALRLIGSLPADDDFRPLRQLLDDLSQSNGALIFPDPDPIVEYQIQCKSGSTDWPDSHPYPGPHGGNADDWASHVLNAAEFECSGQRASPIVQQLLEAGRDRCGSVTDSILIRLSIRFLSVLSFSSNPFCDVAASPLPHASVPAVAQFEYTVQTLDAFLNLVDQNANTRRGRSALTVTAGSGPTADVASASNLPTTLPHGQIVRQGALKRKRGEESPTSIHSCRWSPDAQHKVLSPSSSASDSSTAGSFSANDDQTQTNDTTPSSPIASSPPDIAILSCPICEAPFKGAFRKRNLVRHRQARHEAGIRTILECRKTGCGNTYKRSDSRLAHERDKHPELRSPPLKRRTSSWSNNYSRERMSQ